MNDMCCHRRDPDVWEMEEISRRLFFKSVPCNLRRVPEADDSLRQYEVHHSLNVFENKGDMDCCPRLGVRQIPVGASLNVPKL